MTKPKFNNKPNKHLWVSRAVAVVGIVFAITLDGMKVLIAKRSDKMMDEAGKYGIPCGYLDWNETTFDGMTREVYEETSLYLPDHAYHLVTNNNKIPFTIHDSPANNRQNVSLLFLSVYNFSPRMDMFPVDIEQYTNEETSEVKWISLTDFYLKYDHEYEWAFNHNETIKEAVKHFNRIDSAKL
jgi:8-oxo-dGTP pyrophosphatase MutT (NUDIX family)